MSKTDRWMPLYIGDYLGDTSRLTTEGHGAYVLLLMDYWRNGAPPDDDETLASIARLPLPRWRKLRPSIECLFKPDGGFWHHKRADAEREKAGMITKERSAAGKAGAQVRWGNRDSKPIANAKANAIAEPKQNDGPSQLHSSNEEILVDFKVWYARYPRKVKPEKAKAAYLKARKSADAETLLAGLDRYIIGKPDYADWAHPTTWLNDKRWLDQQDSIASKGKPASANDPLTNARRAADCINNNRGYMKATVSAVDVRQAIAAGLTTAEAAKAQGWSL